MRRSFLDYVFALLNIPAYLVCAGGIFAVDRLGMLAGGVDELAAADVELVAAFKSNERMRAVYRYIIGEGLTFVIFFLAVPEERGVV